MQKPVPLRFHIADCLKFNEIEPSQKTDLVEHWYGRGQNFVVAYSVAREGALLERIEQNDEYMLILPDQSTAVTISVGGETVAVGGYSLTIVPPGRSAVVVQRGGVIVRIFTTRAADLATLCLNRSSYLEPDPNVPPYRAWPAPFDGYRIRSYSLDVAENPERFGRIWQSSNLMVNIFYPQGPRDIRKMTPHHHDDFQQGLLILEGECINHLRWPWTADLSLWREDEHLRCGAPSLTVIPPPAIHTSQMIGANNLLIDIFSPPREDFSAKDGWVLNHDEYPVPQKDAGDL
ncbi:MAG: hypothetical protein K0S56_2388 [Microvirga sp.]|nr:hypothetical protein [Microvirga sp.]